MHKEELCKRWTIKITTSSGIYETVYDNGRQKRNKILYSFMNNVSHFK